VTRSPAGIGRFNSMGEQDHRASGGGGSEESGQSNWHAWSAEEVLEHFETDADKGLDGEEVAAR
jgi:hypothetical protein